MHFIIAGTVLDGVEIYGPFADDDSAVEWASSNVTEGFQLFQPTAPEGEEKSAALIQIWDEAVNETEMTDLAGDIKDPETGAQDSEQRQLWYYNDILAAFYHKDVQLNAVAPRGHQCESWQLQESAKGGKYCGACGRHLPNA